MRKIKLYYNKLIGFLVKHLRNKFIVFVIILFTILILSWCISLCLSYLQFPAWNSNIDSVEKIKNIPLLKFAAVAFRFLLAFFFAFLYWKASLPFWKEHPIERDRSLFARSGWGMAIYSLGAIIMVVSVLMTSSNLMGADTVYVPNADDYLKTSYGGKFGIIKRSWDVICQFADPGNVHSSTNLQGNIIALLCALAGILCLSGLAVSALVSMIARRTQQWKKGLLHYDKGFDNYVVIIGCNEQTMTIAKHCLTRNEVKYVLIQTRKDVEIARQKLELGLDKIDEERIIFYNGERTSYEDIKALKLEKAVEVYILGENMQSENEQDHDAYNMNCLEHIHKYKTLSGEKNKLKCHVDFEYQSTFMAFKSTHIYRSLNDENIEFLPFNVHEIWAKKVFVDNHAVVPVGKHGENKVIRYLPLDAYWVKREGTSHWDIKYINEDSVHAVHLVIVGMNQMGVALGMQAALLAHFPNFAKTNNPHLRTTITFIDDNALKEGEFLIGRYDALFSLCLSRSIDSNKVELVKDSHGKLDFKMEWIDPMKEGRYKHMGANFMDLQWEFIEGNIASPKIRSYLSALAEDAEHRTTTIAVCFNNPQQSIASALYLPETVLKRSLQILVYQQNSYEMIDKVSTSEKEWKRYERLKPFGIIEGSYYGGALENQLAEFINLVYDYVSQDSKEELSRVNSDLDTKRFRASRLWGELGIVYKLANINLADSLSMKRRSIVDNNINASTLTTDSNKLRYLAWAEHNRWMVERLTMGYRPLDKNELDTIKSNDRIYDKDYYKHKSRAHVDICSITNLKKWDRRTYDRDTDYEIVSRIDDILQWEQMAYLRDIYTGVFHDEILSELVTSMCEVSESYWMSRSLVTKKQWYHVMGTERKDEETLSDEPIVDVTKEEVEEFLLLLNKMTKLQFRLPIKDEWEYAYKNMKELCLDDMEGKVWQWTSTPHEKYTSSFIFCGRSKRFFNGKWKDKQSYWLPNFRSPDLGFRLVLPYHFHISAINGKQHNYNLKDDDNHVIRELVKYMVRVEDENGEIKPFFIQQTPTTQRQWKAVMREANGDVNNPSANKGDYYPIESVSFDDAQEFINKLNSKLNSSFKLPTYEQWRCAVRSKSPKADRDRIMYNEITKSTRRVVWPPKENVIHDMLGNVWEWCLNCSDGKKPLSPEENGLVHVLMGGSWRFTKRECLNPDGSYWIPEYKDSDVGFRLVMEEDEYKMLMKAFGNE
jgi:formylglycine-generating enzyme required for sulfatase activity